MCHLLESEPPEAVKDKMGDEMIFIDVQTHSSTTLFDKFFHQNPNQTPSTCGANGTPKL